MRKLMATIAMVCLAAAASTPSWAMAGLQDLKFDGSLEVSGASAKNETDFADGANDHRGGTATRVRLGANATVTEGVSSRLEVTRTPASALAGGGSALYGNGAKPASAHTEESSFVFNN